MKPTHIWKGKRCEIIARSLLGTQPIVKVRCPNGQEWIVAESETYSIQEKERKISERRAVKVNARAEAVRERMKEILKEGHVCNYAYDFAWRFKVNRPGAVYIRKQLREMMASGEIVFDAETHRLKLTKS